MAKKKRKPGTRPAPGDAARPRGAGAPSRAPVPDRMDLWDRVAWICLHALIVLVPIAISNFGPFAPGGAPLTFDQFDIVKVFVQRGLLLIALGAWLAGILLRGGKVRFTRVEWLILAFLGWVVLAAVFSVHPPTAIFGKYRRFEGLISFLGYGLAFFLALQYADRPARIRSLARSLAIGGFLVAAYGAIQVVGTVGLGIARVLQPLSLVVAVGVPALAVWLGSGRFRDDAEVRRALIVGGVIALAAGVLGFATLGQNIDYALTQGLQAVSIDPIRWGNLPFETNRAFSTFGNPDLLGGYLLFPWAVTIGLALSEKRPLWRGIYWSFTLLNAFVGLTSYVRGAWIGATVALIAIAIAYRRGRAGTEMRLTRLDRVFIGSTAAAAAGVIVGSSLRPDAVRNVATRVASIFDFGAGSALTRFQIWEAARASIAERPIFGWGADTFRLLFPRFKPAEYVEAAGYLSVADNVHNYPLQLASGIGVPGALMLYGLIGWALAVGGRDVFAKGKGPERLLQAGFWAAVLGYAVHLLFGLSVTGSTIFLWLSLGILLSPGAHVRELAAPSWKMFALPVVAVLVLAGTVLNVRYVVADNNYLFGRVIARDADAVERVERAIALNPYNEMYKLELGTVWHNRFRSAAERYAAAWAAGSDAEADYALALDYLAKAEGAYRAVIEYAPMEYDTYVFLANLYNEAAIYLDTAYADEAIEVGQRGVGVSEFGPAIRVQLALAYTVQERFDEAIAELEFATALDSRYTGAYTLLGDTYARVGRTDEARATYEHVLKRYPDDAGALAGLEALEATDGVTGDVD